MPPLPPLNLSFADATSQAANPLAGLLSGGFVVSKNQQFGGRGGTQSSSATPTTSLTPTLTANTGADATARTAPSITSPVTPYADGGFGYTGQPAPAATLGGNSLVLPAAILGAALLLGFVLLKK
jgi:hypothetical protein